MSADLMRQLLALELSTEQALAVLDIIEARESDRKEKGRERWHRWNDKRLSNVSKRKPTLANVSTPTRARVEDSSPKEDISRKEGRKKTRAEDEAAFRSELSSLLDAERIDALVDVRRKKGGKVNGHAARLLIAKINDCGLSPAEAADAMALRNWISIERDWVQPRAASPPRSESFIAAQQALEREGFFTDGQDGFAGHNGHADGLPAEFGDGQAGAVVDFRPGAARRLGHGNH